MTPHSDKRLNLKLTAETDAQLREIAERTGLKMVTIISQGIKHQHDEWTTKWTATQKEHTR